MKKAKKPSRNNLFAKLADCPIRTEALRIARAMVKAELKRCGVKISDVEASEITKATKACLNDTVLGNDIVRQAIKEIKDRNAKAKQWAKEGKL